MVQEFVSSLEKSSGTPPEEAEARGRRAAARVEATPPPIPPAITEERGKALETETRAAVETEEAQSYTLTDEETQWLGAWRNFRELGGYEPALPDEVRTRLEELGLLE